jgi:hypothetical protein
MTQWHSLVNVHSTFEFFRAPVYSRASAALKILLARMHVAVRTSAYRVEREETAKAPDSERNGSKSAPMMQVAVLKTGCVLFHALIISEN